MPTVQPVIFCIEIDMIANFPIQQNSQSGFPRDYIRVADNYFASWPEYFRVRVGTRILVWESTLLPLSNQTEMQRFANGIIKCGKSSELRIDFLFMRTKLIE